MYNRLDSFLNHCNILSDSQYGFFKGKGTTDALNRTTDIIYSHLDKRKPLIIFPSILKPRDVKNKS